MSWLSSFLNPGRGYDSAQEQLNNYYGQSQGYLNPYNNQGQEQYGNLNQIIQKLMNPSALLDEWSNNYNESDLTKQTQDMAQQHGLDAASSMGLMGSNTALNATQAGTTQIGLDAKQKYLDDMMQKYMNAAGLSQGIYGQGANAAGQMSNNANTMGQNSAQMAFGKQNAGGSLLGGLLGAGIGGLSGGIGNAIGNRWNLTGGK